MNKIVSLFFALAGSEHALTAAGSAPRNRAPDGSCPVLLKRPSSAEVCAWLDDPVNGIASMDEVFVFLLGFAGGDLAELLGMLLARRDASVRPLYHIDCVLTDAGTKELASQHIKEEWVGIPLVTTRDELLRYLGPKEDKVVQ